MPQPHVPHNKAHAKLVKATTHRIQSRKAVMEHARKLAAEREASSPQQPTSQPQPSSTAGPQTATSPSSS